MTLAVAPAPHAARPPPPWRPDRRARFPRIFAPTLSIASRSSSSLLAALPSVGLLDGIDHALGERRRLQGPSGRDAHGVVDHVVPQGFQFCRQGCDGRKESVRTPVGGGPQEPPRFSHAGPRAKSTPREAPG